MWNPNLFSLFFKKACSRICLMPGIKPTLRQMCVSLFLLSWLPVEEKAPCSCLVPVPHHLCSSHVPALCMKDVNSSFTPFLELSMLSAFLLLISFPEIFLMPTALGEGAAQLAGTVLLGSGSVTASGLVKPAHTWNKLAKTANSANLEAPDEKVCASPPLQGALLLFCDFWAF